MTGIVSLQWVSLNLLLLPRTNQRQELHINIQQQLNFPKHWFAPEAANDLRNRITEGCILRCQDPAGDKYIYGTGTYLLFGELTKVIGKKVTDFTGYELKLSGTSQYPLLQYYSL